MEALIKGAYGYTVDMVICNKPDAVGISKAKDLGVQCIVESSLHNIENILNNMQPDLVCMAGFMRILPQNIVENHTIMNIHPSLLPKYPGLRAVKQALDDGAKYTGCTVHFADAGVDTGSIILQTVVAVKDNDTEDTLAARILEYEHYMYVKAARWYASFLREKN